MIESVKHKGLKKKYVEDFTACHINVRDNAKKDGGMSVVTKRQSAVGTFF
jgi:hypothetical protein